VDSNDSIPVLITVKFDAESLSAFRDVSSRIEILYHPARQVRDVPEDVWNRAEVLYTLRVVPDPALAPALRWVHVHYAGIDHLLEQPIVQTENVTLTTSSGIHSTTIAEYVFMMLLAFGHRLPVILEHQAQALWPDEIRLLRFMPFELRGSTLGIVGYGSLGREIARLANLFGMEVLASKRDVRHPIDSNSYVMPGTGDPESVYYHRLYPPEALNSMLRECDFVVLTLPLTSETRGMFGAEAFAAMKKMAYLVNVSRGGVVDEDALLDALQNKQIAGAAMDVFESEPLPADSPLWKQPNLIVSPHVSGIMGDYNEKAAQLFIENLRRYIARKDLLNVVNLQRGY
jgi:phosphoglycerate dehydrogenase-like enzyme